MSTNKPIPLPPPGEWNPQGWDKSLRAAGVRPPSKNSDPSGCPAVTIGQCEPACARCGRGLYVSAGDTLALAAAYDQLQQEAWVLRNQRDALAAADPQRAEVVYAGLDKHGLPIAEVDR